jgi:hypothetical protein
MATGIRKITREDMAKAHTPADWLRLFPNPDDELGRYLHRMRKFAEIFRVGKADDRDEIDRDEIDRDDGGGSGGGSASDHHASKVADLLVEAGSHPSRASALGYLLHNSHGQALLARMHKKESPMQDTVFSIMKSGGIAATCAAIVAKGSTSISEHELVDAVTKVAAERHPELSPAQAFAKVYTAPTDEARVLQKAIDVAKAMPILAELTPLVVGGVDAMHEAVDDTESSEAYAKLKELGRRKWPTASEAQQFANAFTDPANATLAQEAHRRPTPPMGGAYPFPR